MTINFLKVIYIPCGVILDDTLQMFTHDFELIYFIG